MPISTTSGPGLYQDDGLSAQQSSYWPQQGKIIWHTGQPVYNLPLDGNSTPGGQNPTSIYYHQTLSQNHYTMPPYKTSNGPPLDQGLGTKSDPIVLGSDDDEIPSQGGAPAGPDTYVQIPSTSYNSTKAIRGSRKRKKEEAQAANKYNGEPAFWIGSSSWGGGSSKISSSRGVPKFKANETPNLLGPPQTSHWSQQAYTELQKPVTDSFSDYISSGNSKNGTQYNSAVYPLPGGEIKSSIRKPSNSASQTLRFDTSSMTNSNGLEKSRNPTQQVSPVDSVDLKRVQDFLSTFLDSEKTAALPCPHVTPAFSNIISTVRSEERKKTASCPYSNEGKACFFKCTDCKMMVCVSCGTKVGKVKTPTHSLVHYCVDSHLLSIALVLAKLDCRWHLRESGSPAPTPQKKANSRPHPTKHTNTDNWGEYPMNTHPSVFGTGSSIPTSSRSGIGYGTGGVGRKGASAGKRPTKSATKVKQESDDNNYLSELLVHLISLLQDDEEEFAMISLLAERQDVLVSLIKTSYLPELIRSLVRNDSIMDIDAGNTWDLYSACLELLRTFSLHEALLDLLITALREKKSSPGIAGLVRLPDNLPVKALTSNRKRAASLMSTSADPVEFVLQVGVDGIAQPIIQSFERLVKQCQAFMNNASRVFTSEEDEETNRLLDFCINVDATSIELTRLADELQRRKDQARPSTGNKNSHLASLPSSMLSHPVFSTVATSSSAKAPSFQGPLEVPPEIKQACKEALTSHLQFKYSTSVITTHSGAQMTAAFGGEQAVNGTSAPGRMKRLIKELTVLSTTLPPGIFIRVQEDQPELFKAMIVGPESSPYHMGLYEFDFTIPPNYPNVPPTVNFRTTGGGRVRFNPNLYESGKVCLSILGTWSGSASEQWQPKTSTLLQVLVSIQSMILCAEPYYNEPGYEQNPDARASKSYNENVQLNSIQHAMNDWLSYTGLWNDVVHAHFLAYTAEILSTTHDFVSSCRGNDSYGSGPYQGGFGLIAGFFGGAQPPPPVAALSLKNSIQTARTALENSMKARLPAFIKGGLWKEQAGI